MLLALPFMPHDEGQTCNPIALPAIAALCTPYLIRFVQCLHVHRATGATPQLFNALKYLSAFPALALTVAEHEHHVRGAPFPWRNAWLLASAFNSLFSYYWDVEQVGARAPDRGLLRAAVAGGGRRCSRRQPRLQGLSVSGSQMHPCLPACRSCCRRRPHLFTATELAASIGSWCGD
jgi:hypothetical protein